MKSVFLVFTVLFSFAAQAEVRTDIKSVSKLNYDGQTLDVEYQVGGGCAEHTPLIEVSLQKIEKRRAVAVVKVIDIASKPDFCEALLYKNSKVNLSEKIAEEVKKQDQTIYAVEVVLPQVLVFVQ